MADPTKPDPEHPTATPGDEPLSSPEAIDPSTEEDQQGVEETIDRFHERALRKASQALDELRKLLH